MQKDWSSFTVAQLKQYLKERGLPVAGKKADLVARLEESDKEQGAEEPNNAAAEQEVSDTPAAPTTEEPEPASPTAKGNWAAKATPASKRKSAKAAAKEPEEAEEQQEEPMKEPESAPEAAAEPVKAAEEPKPDAHEEEEPDFEPDVAHEQPQQAEPEAQPQEPTPKPKGRPSAQKQKAKAQQQPQPESDVDMQDVEKPAAETKTPARAKRKGKEAPAAAAAEQPDVSEQPAQPPASDEQRAKRRKHEPIPAPSKSSKSPKASVEPSETDEPAENDIARKSAEISARKSADKSAEKSAEREGPRLSRGPSGGPLKRAPSPSPAAPEPPANAPPVPGDPTRALRIDKFVRPFTDVALKKMLSVHGEFEDFWMPTIKTHCYVIFPTDEIAAAVAASTNHIRWPQDNRNSLPSHVHSSNGRRMIPEVATSYLVIADAVAAILSVLTESCRLQPRFVSVEEAEEAIAIGRGERPAKAAVEVPVRSSKDEERGVRGGSPLRRDSHGVRERENGRVQEPAVPEPKSLDELFRRTTALPPIYWLPLSDAEARQKRLKREEKEREEKMQK